MSSTKRPFRPTPEQAAQYAVPAALAGAFSAPEVDNFRKIFAYYDVDGSGSVDRAEITEVLTKFNDRAREKGASDGPRVLTGAEIAAEVDAMLAAADATSDAEIEFGEFLLVMLNARRRHEG